MLFFHVGLATQIVMVVLFLLLPAGGRLMANRVELRRDPMPYSPRWECLDPDALGLPWLHVVSRAGRGRHDDAALFHHRAYTFTTTSASAFICAMRRMRVPEAVVIPCVVVIRFFPTIAEDYRQIRNAMALRGIASGGWGLVRHPAQSVGIHSDSAADERHQCSMGPVGGGPDQGGSGVRASKHLAHADPYDRGRLAGHDCGHFDARARYRGV